MSAATLEPSTAPRQITADYTLANIAERAQMSRRNAERLHALGRIPGAYRIGRLLRFRRQVIDRWFEAGCRDPK